MIRAEISMVIDRPIEEVYRYMSDPENNSQWQSHCLGDAITSEGPIGVDTTFSDGAKFLGRRIELRWH